METGLRVFQWIPASHASSGFARCSQPTWTPRGSTGKMISCAGLVRFGQELDALRRSRSGPAEIVPVRGGGVQRRIATTSTSAFIARKRRADWRRETWAKAKRESTVISFPSLSRMASTTFNVPKSLRRR